MLMCHRMEAFRMIPPTPLRPETRQPPYPGCRRAISIGNASGFYGDRLSGFEEMVEAGVDVITGDYLAELTMLILARQMHQNPLHGYARTFLAQIEHSLDLVAEAGTKVVVNAGGMNPAGLAAEVRSLAKRRGHDMPVAYVDGDDLTGRSAELGLGDPLAANAYLGGWGITEALTHGAQVVITGRVTDAAVTTGSAAWHHGWARTDYDAIAGAMAAGHVIECGMQATGGNFAFFKEIPDLLRPGFPLAQISANGDSVISKLSRTGGAVTAETVLSQLLYEIGGARYAGPDATLRLDSITVQDLGSDRVRITGVRGEAPPPDLKVSVTEIGGYRQQLTFPLIGLDIEAKAELVKRQYDHGIKASGLRRPERMEWTLARTDRPNANVEEEAAARLTLTARDPDPTVVGRAFANVAVEFALGSIPGFFTDHSPAEASVYGRFRAKYVPQQVPQHTVHLQDGPSIAIPPPIYTRALKPTTLDTTSPGHPAATPAGQPPGDIGVHSARLLEPQPGEVSIPLGTLFGARSGDKGGSANVGVWARSAAGWGWLRSELTSDRLRALLPEIAPFSIARVELDRLRAVNFVIDGILGEGVAYGARFDAQAKGLGEWLRSRYVSVPHHIVNQQRTTP